MGDMPGAHVCATCGECFQFASWLKRHLAKSRSCAGIENPVNASMEVDEPVKSMETVTDTQAEAGANLDDTVDEIAHVIENKNLGRRARISFRCGEVSRFLEGTVTAYNAATQMYEVTRDDGVVTMVNTDGLHDMFAYYKAKAGITKNSKGVLLLTTQDFLAEMQKRGLTQQHRLTKDSFPLHPWAESEVGISLQHGWRIREGEKGYDVTFIIDTHTIYNCIYYL